MAEVEDIARNKPRIGALAGESRESEEAGVLLAESATWAAWVTASAALISLAILAVGSLLGLRQLHLIDKGRHVDVLNEFTRRWDDDGILESRKMVAAYDGRPDELAEAIQAFDTANANEYFVLVRLLNFPAGAA